MKNKKKQSNKHSFYKEAKKSFAGESEFSAAKLRKSIFKYSKWSLYLFLIVSTLWGCVNQFRNTTSQNVSQGIEFYRTDNDVWSNLYGSEKIVTYQNYNESKDTAYKTTPNYEVWTNNNPSDISTKKSSNYQGEVTGKGEIGGLEPLDFYTFNPNWDNDVDPNNLQERKDNNYGPDTNIENPFVKVSDLTDSQGNPTPRTYSYQAQAEDAYGFLIEVLLVDWNVVAETFDYGGNDYSYIVVNSILPSNFKESNESNSDYDINSWSRWYWEYWETTGIGNNKTPSNIDISKFPEYEDKMIWVYDESEPDDILKDEQGFGVLNTNNYFLSYKTLDASTENNIDPNNIVFVPRLSSQLPDIKNLTDKEKELIILEQTKISMNYISFNKGSKITPTSTIKTEEGQNITLENAYKKTLADEGIQQTLSFTYEASLPSPINNPSTITHGTELFVFAQNQDNPLRPSSETIKEMEILRKEAVDQLGYGSWKDLPTNNGTGADLRVDNAGWAILNNNELVKVKDKNSGDEIPLWGLTKELNHGAIVNNQSTEFNKNSIVINESNYQYVLDEQIKQLVMSDSTIDNSKKVVLGLDSNQTEYLAEIENDFIGMTDITEIGYFATQRNYVLPMAQRGVSQSLIWTKDLNNKGKYTVDTYQQTFGDEYWRNMKPVSSDYYQKEVEMNGSKTTSAIQSSGESPTNYTRVIFAGWSDWSKAWDPDFGPMHGVFVFPIAMVSTEVISWMPYSTWGAWGVLLGMLIIIFSLRTIGVLLSWKSQDSQMKMQEVQTEIAEIKAKYEQYDKSNKKMKQKQQQEIMALYKKKDINPFQSFGTLFLTMPIFLSMWTIISSIVTYKIAAIGIFQFSVSAFTGMFNIGAMFALYLLIGVLVGLSQGVSSKLPSWLSDKRNGITRVDDATKKARKKQNKIQNIMIGVFIFIGLTIPTLLAFYWILSGLFTMSLELVRHFSRTKKAKRVAEK